MAMVAWSRSYAVLLPEIMASFALSEGEGGRFIATIEGGSFVSLLILGFIIERIGALRVVLFGLPTVAVSLFVITSFDNLLLLTPVLVLFGMGMAWTATGINTLMATTGQRRSFYLGVMHAFFSAFAMMAPLLAGWTLLHYSWKTWYVGIGVVAIGLTLLLWMYERGLRKPGDADKKQANIVANDSRYGPPFWIILPICLGVLALSGVQGTFNAWSYLYVKETYGVETSFATWAPFCLWGGLLLGRTTLIGMARIFSARTLLIASCLFPSAAMGYEHFFPSPSFSLIAMFLIGLGVSGAYQLGTQWAAERLSYQIGLASTAIMASGWLGNAIGPWVTGEIIERTSYSCLVGIVLTGCLVAALSFGLTRDRRISDNNSS